MLRALRIPFLLTLLLLSTMLLLVACGGGDDEEEDGEDVVAAEQADSTTEASATDAREDVDESATATDEADADEADAEDKDEDRPLDAAVPGSREDVSCALEDIAAGQSADVIDAFTSAYFVVDGKLGAICFGEEDPRLVHAWEVLGVVATADDLGDLVLFAGYDAGPDGDTLAYVSPFDSYDGANVFQMTVNLNASEADETELLLTMAHEFTHIYTATTPQLDRETDAEACDTYFEGNGCYEDDSFMWAWIEAFWSDYIDEIDVDNQDDQGAADDRCAASPEFLGAYAATNPEEDFAESFAAYVFGVPGSPEVEPKFDFFDGNPSLRVFRDRAVAAGHANVTYSFDGCGF